MQTALALVAILSLALHVRLAGVHWDGLAGLHPDERHLLFRAGEMLAGLAEPPAGFAGWWWFDPDSPLNPHRGARSYVYGEAPLLVGVLAGHLTGRTDWFALMALGRQITALVDASAVLAVFLGARLMGGAAAGLAAAILYAAMPSALQLARFFTVDAWLAAATGWALVPLIVLALGRTGRAGPVAAGALAGALGGLALACKLPGALLAAPALVALGLALRGGLGARRAAWAVAAGVLAGLVVFRLANPFAFDGPGPLGLGLSADWRGELAELAQITLSPGFPPNWQWIAGYGTGALLRDVALFGAGPVATALALAALVRRTAWGQGAAVPLALAAAALAMTAMSPVAALRYAAPALAAVAILAGLALAGLARRLGPWPALAGLAVALWWGSGAVRLGDGQHPRLQASHWLWTLPRGTVLTNETAWDEGLPVIVEPVAGAGRRWPAHEGWFTLRTLDITDPDTSDKATRIAETLAATDFLILSSDRQSAVMPRLPDRFPVTAAHYAALLGGTACFAPVLTIDRGYPLPGWRLDDSWAQEPWRVYDHPIVRIFRREPCFDAADYAARIGQAAR